MKKTLLFALLCVSTASVQLNADDYSADDAAERGAVKLSEHALGEVSKASCWGLACGDRKSVAKALDKARVPNTQVPGGNSLCFGLCSVTGFATIVASACFFSTL